MTEAASSKDAGRTFRPGVVLALALAAIFALSGIGVLGAFAPDLDRGDDGRDHALSRSAVGYAGLVKLLEGLDRPVLLSRGSLRGAGGDSLLILSPPPGRESEALDALLDNPAPALIILPKWTAVGDMSRRGWVRRVGTLDGAESLSVLPEDLLGSLSIRQRPGGQALVRLQDWEGRPLSEGVPIEGLRTVSGEGWLPMVTDANGAAVVVSHEKTGIMVLADPDLLNTRGLDDPRKARAAVAVLDTLSDADNGVVFDLSLHGFARPRSVLRLMLEPPLLGFTLCLAFAVALVGWQAMVRFVPHEHARRVVALGKKALADNTAALVRLARREHRMAPPYAELVRSQAAKAVAAPPHLSDDALTSLLDRLAKRDDVELTYAALSAEAEKAKTAGDLMAVARALNRWKSEMTRGRG